MFKKLISRIDAVNEYVNPIVVRDMRATIRYLQCRSLIIAYACLLIMVFLIGYFLAVFAITFSFLMSFVILFKNITRNLDDEMFLLTALTPRQYLHAYMFETFICTFFCTSLFVPVALIICGRSWDFLFLVATMYCGNVLITPTIILVILSFTIQLKAQHYSIVGLLWGFGMVFSIIIFFWCFFSFLPLFTNALRDHLEYYIHPAICISALVSLLLIGSLAYKLSSHAIESRNESIAMIFFLNIFCYVLLGITVSLICFCTVFWVSRF
ncbi:MAG: hypothetical protein LBK06_03325 [Planctomycetaceae bacterium]|jgi:hypothetical protein|nr:hypothetical protein [Planctomycetaceae bacterium]